MVRVVLKGYSIFLINLESRSKTSVIVYIMEVIVHAGINAGIIG